MVAAQQDPQKAPQPQAQPPPHPVDNLHAMVNSVLVSSGRFMKHRAIDVARAQVELKRDVHLANEGFHDSLDQIENDILLAQTVLRRDLALKIADRKKRDAEVREKEAEAARLAAELSAKQNAPPPIADPPAAAAPPQPEPVPQNNEPTTPAGDPPSLKRETEEAVPQPATDSAPNDDTAMENADLGGTAGTDDFDFDALFNDSMDAAPTDDNDVKMDTSGPDLNFSLDEPAPSLLRGLEDFANSGGDEANSNAVAPANSTSMDMDIPMPDFSDAKPQPTEQSVTTKPPEDPPAQLPTSTDELNLDTMTTDNLDDLFNMDYENPEATQFDDAFFGFGET